MLKRLLTFLLACTLFASSALAAVRPAIKSEALGFHSDIKSAPAESCAVVRGRESDAVLYLTNEERLSRGLEPLCSTQPLQLAASIRAAELRHAFSHPRPDGRAFHTVLADLSIKRTKAAENIGVGQYDAVSVVSAWMDSPTHRKAILTAEFRHLGVGYAPGYRQDTYRSHWAQEFIIGHCSFSNLRILNTAGKQVTEVSVPRNVPLSDAGLTLCLDCSTHGICTLPLSDRFCRGYNAARTAAQEVNITVYDLSTKLNIRRGDLLPVSTGSLTNFKTRYEELSRYHDVKDTDWYSDMVYEAGFLGLMNGVDTQRFAPAASLRIAEVLTLAARIHSIYYGGSGDFSSGGDEWYRAAVAYCIAHGIVSSSALPADLTISATRAQTALWLSAAVSADALHPISSRIPSDMSADTAQGQAVHTLYAAGILTGDADSAFHPDRALTRGEAAAIVVRLVQTRMRII